MLSSPGPFSRCVLVVFLLFMDSPFAACGAASGDSSEEPGHAKAAEPRIWSPTSRMPGKRRTDFEALLKRLPPAVGRVMRIDPSLMRNEAYLAPYASLAAFLQHTRRSYRTPATIWSTSSTSSGTRASPRTRAREAVRIVQQHAAGSRQSCSGWQRPRFALLWIIKTLVDYRRWYRTSKVQTEVHTKLLDRFTSNEDLMAYMQTPSGRRFLESAPIPIEGPTRSVGAPLSRILWSLQAGVVLAVAGLGILFVSGRVIEEVAQAVFALGVLVLALGAGFVVSAAASFLLSRRLGLLDAPTGAARAHRGDRRVAPAGPEMKARMPIRDVTLTDIDRLRADADTADVAFEMDEETFRAFYERTARSVWSYLSRLTATRNRPTICCRRPTTASCARARRGNPSRTAAPTCFASRPTWSATGTGGPSRHRRCSSAIATSRPTAMPAPLTAVPTSIARWPGSSRASARCCGWPTASASRTPKSPAPSASPPAASSRSCSAPAASSPACCAASTRPPPEDTTVTFVDCPREQDVIDALTTEQWPDRCDEDLRRHVAACEGCRDLIAVVAPLGDSWTERARRGARAGVRHGVVAGTDAGPP